MRVVLGVSMGNPSGIGPEVLIRSAVRFLSKVSDTDLIIFGNRRVIDFYCSILEEGDEFRRFVKDLRVGVADIGSLNDDDFLPGRPSEAGNIGQIEFIREMVSSINAQKISGMVTMPISKAGLLREGLDIPGHTDLFKRLFAVNFVQMLFYVYRKPFVALNTIHLPLSQVPKAINKEQILRNIRMLNFSMVELFRIKEPNIAVCGLNPHAGEEGLLGLEDREIIKPAIDTARKEGIQVNGPYAADSIFYMAFSGRFNAVLAMYHDQALIPVKLIGISRSVNITLGLPIIRTSPAHGTAFEIAGKGIADYRGALLALDIARKIVRKAPGRLVWNY